MSVENKDWVELKERLIRLVNNVQNQSNKDYLRDELVNIILLFMPEIGVIQEIQYQPALNKFFEVPSLLDFCENEAAKIQSKRMDILRTVKFKETHYLHLKQKLYNDSITIFGQKLTTIFWPQGISIEAEINSTEAEVNLTEAETNLTTNENSPTEIETNPTEEKTNLEDDKSQEQNEEKE